MWTTLLIMAVAVSLEPVRVGLTVLMLNRPRPVLQLTAFLFGGFLMGVCVGVAALLVLHAAPITSSGLTVPRVQIAIGVLALAAAAVLASKAPLRRREAQLSHATTASNGPGAIAIAPAPPGAWAKVCARSRELLGNSSLWVAGVSGLGIALPSVDYLAALAVIHASHASPAVQLGALLGFNLVAFSLVELPLVGYLVAPQRTLAALTALNEWVRSRSRRDVAAILAAAGLFLIGLGAVGL